MIFSEISSFVLVTRSNCDDVRTSYVCFDWRNLERILMGSRSGSRVRASFWVGSFSFPTRRRSVTLLDFLTIYFLMDVTFASPTLSQDPLGISWYRDNPLLITLKLVGEATIEGPWACKFKAIPVTKRRIQYINYVSNEIKKANKEIKNKWRTTDHERMMRLVNPIFLRFFCWRKW